MYAESPPDEKPTRIATVEWLALAATTVLSVGVMFCSQLANRFTRLFGDHYDGFIELSILQHWDNVLHGKQAWNITGYFHPYANTLGYNDGYVVYGVVYTIFHALGADPLLASELMHMTIKAVGAIGMYVLLRTVVRCRVVLSLVGAAVFTLTNSNVVQASHTQLFTLAFAPIAAVLLIRFFESLLRDGRGVLAWGASFALFYALWLLTAYYVAWFFGFFTIAVGVVAISVGGRSTRSDVWAALRRHSRPLVAVGALFSIAIVPFLSVYLPKARETGMHGWLSALGWALNPIDVVNVGPGNLMWGRLIRAAGGRDGEFITGFPLVLFALACGGLFASMRSRESGWARAYKWVAIAVVVTWLLALNIGKPGTFSPWEAVFRLFPGAKGVRVIARYQIFLTLPVVVFALRWLQGLSFKASRLITPAVLMMLVLEQVNTRAPLDIDRPEELAMLSAIPPMPDWCESFYVVSPRTTPYPRDDHGVLYAHNVDAMVIGALAATPTILGFSTFNPPDWNFSNPSAADYRDRVHAYLRAHDLHNVCYLDRQNSADWIRDES